MRASSLAGDEVRNRDGERLGRVEEIMIDIGTGRIAYAVMSTGGFLGRGDKYFAIPWGLISIDAETHDVIVDIDKDVLRDAPGLDRDDWPDIDDSTRIGTVDDYYGSEPGWESEEPDQLEESSPTPLSNQLEVPASTPPDDEAIGAHEEVEADETDTADETVTADRSDS
jgi:sporulation protein YlmC with PRC-barrel domain